MTTLPDQFQPTMSQREALQLVADMPLISWLTLGHSRGCAIEDEAGELRARMSDWLRGWFQNKALCRVRVD